jgi:hypothetical protein
MSALVEVEDRLATHRKKYLWLNATRSRGSGRKADDR